MGVLNLALQIFKQVPYTAFLLCKDMYKYIKSKDWENFKGFGLHVYVGKFGASKTSAMVRHAYQLARRYSKLTILTNIQLKNFPKHTKIIPLNSPQDILNAPNQTLVLIDEIGTIFNSRDFAKSKESVPKPVYQFICQNRHKNIKIIGSCQFWDQYDKQLRQITATVTDCRIYFKHPFSRLSILREYDAREYDKAYNNPLVPISVNSYDVYVQTDKLRSMYDTNQLITNLLKSDYIPDNEIIENTSGDVNIIVSDGGKSKTRKKRVI